MLAIRLKRAIPHPIAVPVHIRKAPDVHHPQIQRCLACHCPFGQHPARPATRGDAEGVEPGPNEHIGAFIGPPEDEIAVGGKRFRSIDHLFDPGIGQRRDAGQGLIHMLFEMIVIIVKQPEFPIVRHIAGHPRLRVGFIAADDQTADFLFEIGAPVGVAQGGRISG